MIPISHKRNNQRQGRLGSWHISMSEGSSTSCTSNSRSAKQYSMFRVHSKLYVKYLTATNPAVLIMTFLESVRQNSKPLSHLRSSERKMDASWKHMVSRSKVYSFLCKISYTKHHISQDEASFSCKRIGIARSLCRHSLRVLTVHQQLSEKHRLSPLSQGHLRQTDVLRICNGQSAICERR